MEPQRITGYACILLLTFNKRMCRTQEEEKDNGLKAFELSFG